MTAIVAFAIIDGLAQTQSAEAYCEFWGWAAPQPMGIDDLCFDHDGRGAYGYARAHANERQHGWLTAGIARVRENGGRPGKTLEHVSAGRPPFPVMP